VLDNPKVEVHYSTALDEIKGVMEPHRKVTSIVLKSTADGTSKEVPMDGVFIAIGHKPNSDLFKGVLDMDEVGYLKVGHGTTETKIPGVFACGDVTDPTYRQAVTAAGTGCMAAIDAERWLQH
jgi:thioredoxin reductase (NADPH)